MLKLSALALRLGIVALLFPPLAAAQSNQQECRAGSYRTAIRLMRVFYPDLRNKGIIVQTGAYQPFEADCPSNVFDIWVSDMRPTEPIRTSPNPSSAERVGHLSNHFEFDGRDGEIHLVFAKGSLVNSERQEALAKLIDEHSEWTAEDMTKALRSSGAAFGPGQKEALLARFPIKELEPILGKIQIESTEFIFRSNATPPSYAVMCWSVRFAASKNSKTYHFAASLEAFEGRVVMLGR
jgi:hypothetical protein